MVVTNGTFTSGYVKTSDFRAYNGYTLTITAPGNGKITSIKSTKGGKTFTAGVKADVGTLKISNNAINWSGSNNSVKLSVSGTVSFATITVTFENGANLTSLAISGEPTKKTYNVGEELDPTGLVVTGTYDDNSTAVITKDITWTKNPATLAVGNTSCSVSATVGDVTSEPYEVTGLEVTRTITLAIDPATSTVVKAPVTVTLTASEGATVYYTTNGDEPTTSSTKYEAPFEVTKSGTTVKAIAVAEGADDVKAEATYTIQPDQPVFSDASKTFKDAFDVTLSLPTSTDETSTIHYAIGATATAESPVYDGPINISAENDGDKVILHAVVVDQYGNVGKEKYFTYTKTNSIVFDFTANPNVWGITPTSNNKTTGDNVVAGKELEVAGVVMTATNGSSLGTCLVLKSSKVTLNVYQGCSITFTAPKGYNLSQVTFAGTTQNLKAANYSNPTWTGNEHSVTFSNNSTKVEIKTATIKLVAVAEPEPTSGTLTFKAQDSEGYYATFSTDKDVVFTDDVIVYGVSVAEGKASLNEFSTDPYEVTDASVGENTGIVEVGYYVPANTGVLVTCTDETASYYFPKDAQSTTLPANQLKPATAEGGVLAAENGYKYYKLAYGDYSAKSGLGFYWGADNGGAFFVKAGTAYLAVPAAEAQEAKGFSFDGETTGIDNVSANDNKAKVIYNLNGQRVANMSQAGLYIVNGKKVVIRK